MTVYLLVDKATGEVVDVYKYERIALEEANREGIKQALLNTFGGKSSSNYRVEVRRLVE